MIKRVDKIGDFQRGQRRAIVRALLVTAELVATKIREVTPVQTGRLRESIKSTGSVIESGDQFTIRVVTPVKYAPYVELGTSRFAPRAMFRKGVDENKALFAKTFENIIRQNI